MNKKHTYFVRVSAKTYEQLNYGDNLDILRKFVRDKTFDLCYIDPPPNSKRNYNQIYNNIGSGRPRAGAGVC